MRITTAWLVTLVCALPVQAAVHHSSDFGWAAHQDVTESLAKLLKSGKLRSGDELVLDRTYRIRGTHELPDNFTLSAKKGAGFEVTDAKTNSKPLLELGNKATLHNLTIIYVNTPELGGRSYKHGVDFFDKRAINASGKSNILIKSCRLEGMISHHIRLSNCKQPKVIGCHIIGGFWSVVVSGKDLVFQRCLFEKSCCDCIKGGADGALVEDCVFQDTCRDGIDTTGGLNDAVIRNCIFRRLGCCGLDLKSHYEGALGRPENVGILIESCLFSDMPNAVVLTTLDHRRRKEGKDQLTAANMKKYAPHDIDINDCVCGHVEKPLLPSKQGGYGVDYPTEEGEHMRLILLKDAYGIRYRDARLFGDRIKPVLIHSIGGGNALSKEAAEAIDHSVTGNILDEPAPPIEPGVTEVPFACGPQAAE
jgi:hypothetical protein